MIHTSRLNLIPTTLAHLDAELSVEGDPRLHLAACLSATVPDGWPPSLYDVDAMRFFRERLTSVGEAAIGWYGWYAVLRGDGQEPNTLVASGGYFGLPVDNVVEIGYSVVSDYRRRGIATEVIVGLTDHALAMPDVAAVIAHTDVANEGSQRALLNAGFVRCDDPVEPGMIRFARKSSDL